MKSRKFSRRLTIAVAAAIAVSLSLIGAGLGASATYAADNGPSTPPVIVTGTTYYVSPTGSDANTGTSQASPWATLGAVNSRTFQPGDRVLLQAGGTWVGQLALHGSGSGGNPIVVSSYGAGAKPIVAGNGSVVSAVLLSNEQYVTIDGLEVTNSNGNHTWRTGIEVTATDAGALPGISLRNNFVHNIDGPTGYVVSIAHGGIVADIRGSSRPTYFTGMTIENNEISNVIAYGIATWSTWVERDGRVELWKDEPDVPQSGFGQFTPSTGLLIRSNYVHDIGNGGISANEVSGAIIDHNTVANTALDHGNAGVWWSQADNTTVQYNDVSGTRAYTWRDDGAAFDSDQSTYGSVVQYNFSHGNGGGFLMTCSFNSGPAEAIVRNNVSQGDGMHVIFLSCSGQKQVYIYDNTVYASAPATDILSEFSKVADVKDKGVIVHDNIFVNPTGAGWDGGLDVTYWNNEYAGGPIPADPSAITGNPKFVAPGAATSWATAVADYQLQSGSPAIGAGHRVPGDGGQDYADVALPASAPDLGALQSSQVHPTIGMTFGKGLFSTTSMASIVDADPSTSWASPPFVAGTAIYLNYPTTQQVGAVTIGTAFGVGQGITDVTVQSYDSGSNAWVALVRSNLTWNSNTSLVEYRTIQLPNAVSGAMRLVVNAANLQWGHFAINELSLGASPAASLPPTVSATIALGMGSETPISTATGQLSNLTDGVPTTSWQNSSGVFNFAKFDMTLASAVPVHAITVSSAFGQSAGISLVDVQTWNGSYWATSLLQQPITWGSNTSAVESRTITLPAVVTTTAVRLVIEQSNASAGNFQINELTLS